MAHYELWDLASGNQLNHYEDLFDAMNEVREGIEVDGEDAWYEIGLLRRGDDPADTQRIASGPDLVDLALRISAASQRVSRPASSPMARESAN
jgi:hypothetical protein